MQKILDYQIIQKIGEGHFATVYKARKEEQTFAIKILNFPPQVDPTPIIEALRYEFWVLKDLDHPHIVKVFDFGLLESGEVFLVQEFLSGQTLDQFAQGKSFLELEPLFIGCLKALRTVHGWKIIHRDIKPENIMVVDNGKVSKLLDFGLALSHGQQSEMAGTPATMAPELFMEEPPSPSSDLYSLGVCFAQSLLGTNPLVADNLDDTIQNHLKKDIPPLGLKRNDLPPAWSLLIQKMLAKTPQERPVSAQSAFDFVTTSNFQLNPSALIGRDKELKVYQQAIDALNDNKKLCICIDGDKGVGVSRFAKEIFYRILFSHPQHRKNIGTDKKETHKRLFILERQDAIPGIPSVSIHLQPFTTKEQKKWLSELLSIKEIPETVIQKIQELTQGNAQQIWNLLNLLQQKNLLTDASGSITTSKLELIPWNQLFSDNRQLNENFDYLFEELKNQVRSQESQQALKTCQDLLNLVQKEPNKNLRRLRRAKTLMWQGTLFIDLSQFTEANECLKNAETIFKDESGQEVELIRIANFLAYILVRQGQIDKAIELYEKNKELTKKLPNDQQKKVTNLDLGMAYATAGFFEKATTQLQSEIEFHKENAAHNNVLNRLYTLALSFHNLDQVEKAKAHYDQVKELARETKNPAYILRALNGLGNLLQNSNDWSESALAYQKALELALAVNDKTAASAAAQNLGGVKSDHGYYQEAISALENSLKYVRSLKTKYAYEKTLECRALEQLGQTYSRLSQPETALRYLDEAWNLAQADQDLENFRFWILASRCRHWIQQADKKNFDQDFSQINFYAKDDQQQNIKDGLAKDFEALKKTTSSQREEKLQSELERILTINKDLVAETNLQDLLKKILGYAIELSKSELGVILLSNSKGKLVPQMSLNADLDDDLSEISLNIAEKVLSKGQVIKTADAGQDSEFNQYASVMSLNLKSILGLPITFKGKTLGVLYLSHRYRVGAYDNKSIQTMATFADQAGLAIKNHQLLDFYKKTNQHLKENLQESELSRVRAEEKLKQIPSHLKEKYAESNIITDSPIMMDLLDKTSKLAQANISLIVHGESGTGKELVSKFIHNQSPRKKGPFIAINCGALPSNLVESELFGHKKGAFTGADQDRQGLIEAAHTGTLFLDEITDLPSETQVKLLRVLQEREVIKLGETRPQSIDIRVIAASHKNLKASVQKKLFREDLYYRLAGMELHIPALRDRKEDIPILAEHMLKNMVEENNLKQPEKIHKSLLKLMMAYHWPGNVRELRNFIEVGITLASGKVLKKEDLPDYLWEKLQHSIPIKRAEGETSSAGWYDPRKTWREHELLVYASALCHHQFDAQKTALSLGVGIATVYKWLREHKIKETQSQWENVILPYQNGLTLKEIRSHVFQLAAKRHPGHPYIAAKELDVAPVTFYRWSKS